MLKNWSVVFYLVSLIPVGVGFHKLFAYENPDSYFRDSTNAYVGGDAYNYIINAGQATAYFTLATFLAVIASALLISSYLNNNAEAKGDEIVKEVDGEQAI